MRRFRPRSAVCAAGPRSAVCAAAAGARFADAGWTGPRPDDVRGNVKLDPTTNTYTGKVPPHPKETGPTRVFNCHRFWVEGDIATAMDTFAFLFPSAQPPTGL